MVADSTEGNKVALVVAAHPDDPDFGAGGTAALWTKEGWKFHYLVVTNGSKGSGDRTMTRERLIGLRENEQRRAAEELGVRSCIFLGGEDGELEYSREMLGKIVREIRRLQPNAIFTHSTDVLHRRPARRADEDDALAEFIGFVNHRDHRNTGTMAIDAVYPTARDHMNFPEHLSEEGLETHHVKEIYVFGSNTPNFVVDVSSVIDQKIAGLTNHVSQFGDRGEDFAEGMKTRSRDQDGNHYERFSRVVLPR